MFLSRAADKTAATVACMSGSRPRPGPMTSAWRLCRSAMMGEASSDAGVGEGVSRSRGCTIRFGE